MPTSVEAGQDWVVIIRETAPKHDVVGTAGGTDRRHAHVIQVSNNPYGESSLAGQSPMRHDQHQPIMFRG